MKKNGRVRQTLPGDIAAIVVRLLVIGTGLVAVAALVLALRPSSPAPTVTTAQVLEALGEDVSVPRDSGIGGFAELFVSEWFSASREQSDSLSAFTATSVDLTNVAGSTLWPARLATVSTAELDDGSWEVIVAVEVMDITPETTEWIGTEFYLVRALRAPTERGQGFVALGLPALTHQPPTLVAPTLWAEALGPVSAETAEVADALNGFFAAYLTGQGDIARYVPSSSLIKPIGDSRYIEASIDSLAVEPRDDGTVFVRTRLHGELPQGATQILEYTATLSQEQGRWEVTAINPPSALLS